MNTFCKHEDQESVLVKRITELSFLRRCCKCDAHYMSNHTILLGKHSKKEPVEVDAPVVLEDGKYLIEEINGIMSFTRNGEFWAAAESEYKYSGMILCMVQRIKELEAKLGERAT